MCTSRLCNDVVETSPAATLERTGMLRNLLQRVLLSIAAVVVGVAVAAGKPLVAAGKLLTGWTAAGWTASGWVEGGLERTQSHQILEKLQAKHKKLIVYLKRWYEFF